MIKYIERIIDEERFDVYFLDLMTEKEKIELIEEVEFEVIKENGVYRLEDMTGANLGNIESEEFDSIDEIIYRLEIYWNDYYITFNDELEIIKMTIKEYMDKYGRQYEEGELFDYPIDEIDYIISDTDIEKVALIGDRLYEIN